MPVITEPIPLLQQSAIEFGVILVGSVLVSTGALVYFRRVRVDRPPIGTFNGRDIAILLGFIAVLPFLYGYLPYAVVTTILAITFTSALYICWRPVLGAAATWLVIGLLIGLNFWTSYHLEGSTAGWQLWWAELSVMVGCGAVGVANLYVQGGMKLVHVGWLSLGLAGYDIVFNQILPLTDRLIADYISRPLDPLLGMRFGIDNYGVGIGDLLVYSLFLTAAYKAYGWRAARIALGLIATFGALVTAFAPLLFNFLDNELDLLVPAQAFFGPAAFLCSIWMRHRYGRERTMAEYLAGAEAAEGVSAATRPTPVREPASA